MRLDLSPHVRNPGNFGLWNLESTALEILQIISQSVEYLKPSGMLNLELKVKHKSLILWRRNELKLKLDSVAVSTRFP